ncbi:MAG: hypothetical protein Q7J01_00435 [Syntrophales bacterium]|nr:hypothetical protein [Syntrophales bacterium]
MSIDEQIYSLATAITEARWHFQIWEALQEAKANETSVKLMNLYKEFFVPTMSAHFESASISCCQLFETRSDTVNFPSLIRGLKKVEGRDIMKEQPLVDIQKRVKLIWVKISQIRNQSVGHVSSKKPQTEIFAQAGLSPQDVWAFIDLSIKLHQGITYPRNQSIEGFNVNGKPATTRLIESLKKS